ncbi:MAG: hypothetical protein HeimC3_44260 [Candidatus Heimdallarchaeota archaeon LC_3]|nr:MAG: hypothetical protein HeimC3_44260 [Candidatus Heimdallarchaeota archaeon LC_3]
MQFKMRVKNIDIFWNYIRDFQKALSMGFSNSYYFYSIFVEEKVVQGIINSLVIDSQLIYIGSTVRTPSDQLLNNHRLFQSIIKDYGKDYNISFAFGGFSDTNRIIDDELIRNIESMMITHFKPRLNAVDFEDQSGNPIEIYSSCEGFELLNFKLIPKNKNQFSPISYSN